MTVENRFLAAVLAVCVASGKLVPIAS